VSSYNSSGAEQLTLHAPAVLALDGKTKRAIEDQNFPFEHLSELAELESWRKEVNRPIYHLHKWWAQRLLLARDARGVWQMANRLPPLRVVDKAGSLAAHPRSTGRRDVTGTGDQITVTDAVGPVQRKLRSGPSLVFV
jgi:hypothetical protein